jgi:hypothetical protein
LEKKEVKIDGWKDAAAAKFQTELEQELSRSFEHAPVQNEPTKKMWVLRTRT